MCCWLKPPLSFVTSDSRSFSLLCIWLSSELFCFNRLWSRTLLRLQRSASIWWACFTASKSEFNWSIAPSRGEVELSEGEERKRGCFLTCCWPVQSWSCSCCCSFSIRRSISLSFSLSWHVSSWCPRTLSFKCLTSPFRAATWVEKNKWERKREEKDENGITLCRDTKHTQTEKKGSEGAAVA